MNFNLTVFLTMLHGRSIRKIMKEIYNSRRIIHSHPSRLRLESEQSQEGSIIPKTWCTPFSREPSDDIIP